jgi:hypothetical protein
VAGPVRPWLLKGHKGTPRSIVVHKHLLVVGQRPLWRALPLATSSHRRLHLPSHWHHPPLGAPRYRPWFEMWIIPRTAKIDAVKAMLSNALVAVVGDPRPVTSPS